MQSGYYKSGEYESSRLPVAQLRSTGMNLEDNRVRNNVQRSEPQKYYGFQPVQRVAIPVTQFVNDGNSSKLARERFRAGGGKKAKGVRIEEWKRGREAQHLIPAQICKEFGISKDWVNSAENGMMLPSGRTKTNHLRNKRYDKGKRHHIKGDGSHPRYNSTVRHFAVSRHWQAGQVTRQQFLSLALFLRAKNRPRRKGAASGYVDDIQ